MSKIILPLHANWCNMILNGEKPFEFRTKLPKDFEPGTTIYLYETKYRGIGGYVMGECKVKKIINLCNEKGQFPTLGCYNFIDYFLENVKHDPETAERYRKVKEEFKDKFTNYKYGFIIQYAMSDENLASIRETGMPIDTWKIFDMPLVRKILDDIEKSNQLMKECDNWLTAIGLYNDMDESYYRYGIELKDIIRYSKAKPIYDFTNLQGIPLTKAPQSFQYVI